MATEMHMDFNSREYLLITLTLSLLPVLGVEFYGIKTLREQYPRFEYDMDMPQPRDLLIALLLSFVFVALRYACTSMFKHVGRRILSEKHRKNPDRVDRFATVTFKFFYFVGITTFGYWMMKDEDWCIPALGGNGESVNVYMHMNEPPIPALKAYYLIQLGYHFQSLLYMIFLTPLRNDFIEMLLHHLVTIILIGGSYLANFTTKGALVAFTHDIGDVTGYAIKAMVDTGNIPATVFLYVCLLVSWGYTRLYVYPAHLIYNTAFLLPTIHPNISGIVLYPGVALLCMLLLLHVYWYGLFFYMGARLVKQGVAEDVQQKIEDKSKNKKE